MGSGVLPADRATSSCEHKACKAATPHPGRALEDTHNPSGPERIKTKKSQVRLESSEGVRGGA